MTRSAALQATGRARPVRRLAHLGARQAAAWVFAALTIFVAAIAVWTERPRQGQDDRIQVSLPVAASAPAALSAPTAQS